MKVRFGNATAKIIGFLLLTSGLVSTAAFAEVPKGLSDMLKTAATKGDKATFETILQTALATWPGDRNALLTLANTLKPEWTRQEHAAELAKAKADAEAKEQASRARGIFYYLDPKLWNGQAELGAGISTGDTKEKAGSVGLTFKRKFGPKWEHNIDLGFDYARRSGDTTRNRFDGKYEALWKPWDKGFLINYVELELDQFSGYDYRVVENLGFGYQILQTSRQSLRLEAGPGVRFYKVEDEPGSGTEILGRLSSTYEIKFNDSLSLKDRIAFIYGADSRTLENRVQASARINAHLAARLSVEVKYDSEAPDGTAPWDTLTRATFVYDF